MRRHIEAAAFLASLAMLHPADAYAENEATTIWQERALQGEAKAQTALGFLYLTGLRVRQNHTVAARWFQAAADQGDADAQYYLGTLHLEGLGVTSDPVAAHFWCELAIASGARDLLQPAYSCAERAARAMTRDEIRATSLRVTRWQRAAPLPASR